LSKSLLPPSTSLVEWNKESTLRKDITQEKVDVLQVSCQTLKLYIKHKVCLMVEFDKGKLKLEINLEAKARECSLVWLNVI